MLNNTVAFDALTADTSAERPMLDNTTRPVVMTKRAVFDFGKLDMVAIQVNTGAIEIYRNDGGLEMFVGYITGVALALANAAHEALFSERSIAGTAHNCAVTFSRPVQMSLL